MLVLEGSVAKKIESCITGLNQTRGESKRNHLSKSKGRTYTFLSSYVFPSLCYVYVCMCIYICVPVYLIPPKVSPVPRQIVCSAWLTVRMKWVRWSVLEPVKVFTLFKSHKNIIHTVWIFYFFSFFFFFFFPSFISFPTRKARKEKSKRKGVI